MKSKCQEKEESKEKNELFEPNSLGQRPFFFNMLVKQKTKAISLQDWIGVFLVLVHNRSLHLSLFVMHSDVHLHLCMFTLSSFTSFSFVGW